MPTIGAIVWAAIAGLIVLMLGIIGYLIDKGFTSLKADIKEELKTLWLKLDTHQTQELANTLAIGKINERCAILHANHKRESDV